MNWAEVQCFTGDRAIWVGGFGQFLGGFVGLGQVFGLVWHGWGRPFLIGGLSGQGYCFGWWGSRGEIAAATPAYAGATLLLAGEGI